MNNVSGELGPFLYDSRRSSLIVRDQTCERYTACLKVASDEDWPSFTCEGCANAASTAKSVPSNSETAQVEYVSLNVFLQRVQNGFKRRGYTSKNFLRKIRKETKDYYGQDSNEFKYVVIQLKILKAILNEEKINSMQLSKKADRLIGTMRKPPQLHSIYMKVCGSSWLKS